MDETGMPFDPRPPTVDAPKGLKKVSYWSSDQKGQVIVVGCAIASGQAILPFVIFDAKQLNLHLTKGEVPGTRYSLSDSRWIDKELRIPWMMISRCIFLQRAVGPVLSSCF